MNTTDFTEKRTRLLKEIQDEARQTRKWTGRAAFSDRVMKAIAGVPRDQFMSPDEVAFSYVNRPYSIGHGQTISQPYIVALMSDLLDIQPDHRILEVGTGCGYQTAVLASLADGAAATEVRGLVASAPMLRPADLLTTAAFGRLSALDVVVASPDAAGAGDDACAAAVSRKLGVGGYGPYLEELAADGVDYRPLAWTCWGRPHVDAAAAAVAGNGAGEWGGPPQGERCVYQRVLQRVHPVHIDVFFDTELVNPMGGRYLPPIREAARVQREPPSPDLQR